MTTNRIIFPDDEIVTDDERAHLESTIAAAFTDSNLDIHVERASASDSLSVFAVVEVVERELPIDSESDLFANLEAMMRLPTVEKLGGATLTSSETAAALRTIDLMESVVDGSDFDDFYHRPAEVIIRNDETGELVGSVVRLDDGSWVYNKDVIS